MDADDEQMLREWTQRMDGLMQIPPESLAEFIMDGLMLLRVLCGKPEIEIVLDALDRAEPPPEIYEAIRQRLQQRGIAYRGNP